MVQHAAMFCLEDLKLQLNMLSLGHLSPSIITPKFLKSLLISIATQLPPALSLPLAPVPHQWQYYKFLTCTTMLHENQILVIISVPLLDRNGQFEIFQVHNFLVCRRNYSDETSKQERTMLAKYQIESQMLAINAVLVIFCWTRLKMLNVCILLRSFVNIKVLFFLLIYVNYVL